MERIIYFFLCYLAVSNGGILHRIKDIANNSNDFESNENITDIDLVKYRDDGYVYNEDVNIFYKLHTKPTSWRDARKICLGENAVLAMPKNAVEANVLTAIYKNNSMDRYLMCVNFNDIKRENVFVVEDGQEYPLEEYYHEWQEGEPNNMENEDCGIMYGTGKLNDYNCDFPCVFICQKVDKLKDTTDSDKVKKYKFVLDSYEYLEDYDRLKYMTERSFTTHKNEPENYIITEIPIRKMPEMSPNEDSKSIGDESIEKDLTMEYDEDYDKLFDEMSNIMRNNQYFSVESYETTERSISTIGDERERNDAEQNDYVYYKAAKVSYKMHTDPMKWAAARMQCLSEGGVLAMPKNKEELDILMNIFDEAKLPEGVKRDYMWLRFHDMFRENEYITDEGIPIEYYYVRWRFNEPNNIGEEDCGVMSPEGKINDVGCDASYIYICQKEDEPYAKQLLDSFRSENSDKAYVLEPHSRKHFKLHTNPEFWYEARAICQSEGGRLAVINSKEERVFLRELFNDPLNEVIYSDRFDSALLGFHDVFDEGKFVLTTGEPLESLNYVKWAFNEPKGHRDENCGSMNANGELKEFPCNKMSVFFCEKSPMS